jgi:hypothetical protein
MHMAHLAQLESTCLSLLRSAAEDHQADRVSIEASRDADGTTVIELTYSARGVPVAGEGF